MKTLEITQELKEKFISAYDVHNATYPEIAIELGIEKVMVRDLYEKTRSDAQIAIIKKAKRIFSSKKALASFMKFKEGGFERFYHWYAKQERKCFYCKAEEYKLHDLFSNKMGFNTKRLRGSSLELERRDSSPSNNEYSEDNCALICYFCNNHKSDIISMDDHIRYFAPAIKKYIDDKFEILIRLR